MESNNDYMEFDHQNYEYFEIDKFHIKQEEGQQQNVFYSEQESGQYLTPNYLENCHDHMAVDETPCMPDVDHFPLPLLSSDDVESVLGSIDVTNQDEMMEEAGDGQDSCLEDALASDHVSFSSCSSPLHDCDSCIDYDSIASCIHRQHMDFCSRNPGAGVKKKPMIHEFLGYLLHNSFSCELNCKNPFANMLFFCDVEGNRIRDGAASEFFKVSCFKPVAELWRIVKCNNSPDTVTNFKRAMRQSTQNDRKYFFALTNRKHRAQIYKFGNKSLDYFKKVYPHWYSL